MRTEGDIIARIEGDKIIARFSKDIATGTNIIDNRGKSFGRVSDIFGPVDDPYVEIQMSNDSSFRLSMLDKKIYAEE